MKIEAKKIKIVQDILRLDDSSVLSEIEEVLRRNRKEAYERNLYPMSSEELRVRVEESLADFSADRVKRSEDLLKKYGG